MNKIFIVLALLFASTASAVEVKNLGGEIIPLNVHEAACSFVNSKSFGFQEELYLLKSMSTPIWSAHANINLIYEIDAQVFLCYGPGAI